MTTMETDRLVDDYLRRLEKAAAHLQPARRTELLDEIREHIGTALREEDDAGEVTVRNVLERLGRPEEIVAEAEPPAAEAPASTRTGAPELGALLALLVPFAGWLVGGVLVVVSQAWTRRDKVVGLGLLLVLVLLPALDPIAASGAEDAVPVEELGPAGVKDSDEGLGGLRFLVLAVGLPSALYLGWRLRRHPTRS